MEDLPYHYLLFSPFEKGGIVFDQNNCVVYLTEDRQELVSGERPADFEVTGSPVDVGQDAGVVPADVEEHVPLQVLVGVQCCSYRINWRNHRTERSRLKGDGRAQVELHAREPLRLRVFRLRSRGA
jgi:hypothetical protein